jgi:predicted GIY-YIG superfamily endonuclease
MSYELPSRDDPPEEQEKIISEIIQDVDGFEASKNAVYVLKCHSPTNRNDIRSPHDGFGSTHVDEALLADHLYYVGWSNRVAHRILQHIRGTTQGANFTKQYPPETLQEIRWYKSEKQAKTQEEAVAEQYTQRVIDLSKLDEMESVNKTDGVVEWHEIVNAIDEFEISIAYSF